MNKYYDAASWLLTEDEDEDETSVETEVDTDETETTDADDETETDETGDTTETDDAGEDIVDAEDSPPVLLSSAKSQNSWYHSCKYYPCQFPQYGYTHYPENTCHVSP